MYANNELFFNKTIAKQKPKSQSTSKSKDSKDKPVRKDRAIAKNTLVYAETGIKLTPEELAKVEVSGIGKNCKQFIGDLEVITKNNFYTRKSKKRKQTVESMEPVNKRRKVTPTVTSAILANQAAMTPHDFILSVKNFLENLKDKTGFMAKLFSKYDFSLIIDRVMKLEKEPEGDFIDGYSALYQLMESIGKGSNRFTFINEFIRDDSLRKDNERGFHVGCNLNTLKILEREDKIFQLLQLLTASTGPRLVKRLEAFGSEEIKRILKNVVFEFSPNNPVQMIRIQDVVNEPTTSNDFLIENALETDNELTDVLQILPLDQDIPEIVDFLPPNVETSFCFDRFPGFFSIPSKPVVVQALLQKNPSGLQKK